jgi:hypothetical protein
MTGEARTSDPRERLRAIESIIEDLRRIADPRGLAGAQALVGAVLGLHADGIARVLELVRARAGGGGGEGSLLDALAADDLVACLLLLHGLHPVPLEGRVRAALAKVAPIGWTVELVGANEGVVRIDAARSPSGDSKRAPRAEQVRALVERAVEEAAPDAERVEVTTQGDGALEGFVPVERLTSTRPAEGGAR